MPWKNRMSDEEQPEVEGHNIAKNPTDGITPIPEVEGHGLRGRTGLSDESEVEGHGSRFHGLDQNGNQFEIPEERLLSVKWTDAEGEHEVEGHGFKNKFSDEPDTEGHGSRGRLSDQPLTIKFLDEKGEEQEVEGHLVRVSDLRLKQNVSTLDGALARLGSIRTS